MKYLALGYDGNGNVFKTIEAGGPELALEKVYEEKPFGADGDLILLIETPARVHLITPDGDIESRGSD